MTISDSELKSYSEGKGWTKGWSEGSSQGTSQGTSSGKSEQVGGGLGTNVGAGVNTIINEEMALSNYKYGEKAANASDIRTRELYTDLYSPAAKVKQLKEAGLYASCI